MHGLRVGPDVQIRPSPAMRRGGEAFFVLQEALGMSDQPSSRPRYAVRWESLPQILALLAAAAVWLAFLIRG